VDVLANAQRSCNTTQLKKLKKDTDYNLSKMTLRGLHGGFSEITESPVLGT
jgi:hypothetical protein